MKERLQKIIARAGVCSRRKAELLIKEGKVKVNGRISKIGESADFLKDKIYVGNKLLVFDKPVYYMLNKPAGFICSFKDYLNRKTIFSIKSVKNIHERVFHVGRLDKDTTGLLILTNDGDFANKILHPSNEIKKTYFIKLNRKLTFKDKNNIEKGIIVDGKRTYPAKISGSQTDEFEITIHEGRNRIIRKMFLKLGYKVLELKRIKIGSLSLDIDVGKIRKLTKKDLNRIFI